MAPLVERLFPTPEVRRSNPDIGKLLYQTFNCLSTVNCVVKTKIKIKRPGMAHFKKKLLVRSNNCGNERIIKLMRCVLKAIKSSTSDDDDVGR